MSSLAKGGFRKFYWLYDLFESAVQVSTSYIKSVYVVPRHKIILFIAKRHCHTFLPSVFSQVEVTKYWTSAPPRSNILSPPLDCSLMTNMWLLYFDNKYQASHLYIHDRVHVHDSVLQIQYAIMYWVGP